LTQVFFGLHAITTALGDIGPALSASPVFAMAQAAPGLKKSLATGG